MRKKITVLTGAGISAESGLNTFRDNNGLWANYKVEDVASIEGWNKDPQIVLDFYNDRRLELEKALPNNAHKTLANLEDKYDVHIITQNVDNLHERAGSSKILHLHGELTKVRPEHGVYDTEKFSEQEVFDIGYTTIQLGDLAPNGSQLRPHIVWFGEAVPKIERAIEIVAEADIILIIGTSLKVYPAAGLYRYASENTPIYLIDPNDIKLRDKRIVHIKDIATKGICEFLNILDKDNNKHLL